MIESEQIEEIICLVSSLDRSGLIRLIKSYPGSFPLDFTSEFLQSVDLDRLRHIYVAICLRCRQAPELDATAA